MNHFRSLACNNLRLSFNQFLVANRPSIFYGSSDFQKKTNPNINCSSRSFSFQAIGSNVLETQRTIFKTLSDSTPVEYAQNFLITLHDTTALSWCSTIVCSTILLRTCITVPLSIYQSYILAKLENIRAVKMPQIATELKKEVAVATRMYDWDMKMAELHYKRSIKKQYDKLIVQDNCHPFKSSILLWFQIPLWISLSVSLRNLVYMLPNQDINAKIIFTELTIGGFGWIPNLTEVDSSLILPVIFGLVNLAIIEIQVMSKIQAPNKLQKYLTNFFRGFSIFMVPVAATVPSCVVLYWTTSSIFGLVQNLVLMSPKVKRIVGIPETPSELKDPYKHLIMRMKNRIKLNSQ